MFASESSVTLSDLNWDAYQKLWSVLVLKEFLIYKLTYKSVKEEMLVYAERK